MAYSPPMAYGPPMAYATPPPSYAPPSYGGPSSYGSDPIPLVPLVVPGDPQDPSAGGGGGGGGMVTKFLALPLPLIVVLPILLPIIAGIVIVAGGGVGGGGGGGQKLKKALEILLKKLGKKNKQPLARTADAEIDETPYYNNERYGNDYQHASDNRQNEGDQNRYRRQVGKSKNIPATSFALPSMSVAQVERLTQVVYAAMNSQECIQLLLCELGSLSRSFSDSTRTVTKAVEEYVPEKLKDSFNVFAKAENCEQYKCGSLKVKN